MLKIPKINYLTVDDDDYWVYATYTDDDKASLLVAKVVRALGKTFHFPVHDERIERELIVPVADPTKMFPRSDTYGHVIQERKIDLARLRVQASKAVTAYLWKMEAEKKKESHPYLYLLHHVWGIVGPHKWRFLAVCFMLACTVYTLLGMKGCVDNMEKMKVQSKEDHALWEKNGCYVYRSECGGKSKYACEIKAPYQEPFTMGQYRITPYPTCKEK